MITLKTLPQATEQEIYNQVKSHLLQQMEKSRDEVHGCAYRSDSGLKCAAGCLIGDDEYTNNMEGKNWLAMVLEGHSPRDPRGLIYDLQLIHDTKEVEYWEEQLESLALEFGLQP